MKEKFKWGKFIVDCLICLGIVIISPFIYSYLIKSDDLRWILYPFQWLLQPTQWLLYPLHWFFDTRTHTIKEIAEFIVGFFSLAIVSFFIINFFYKMHRLSLFLSFIFMVCYTAFAYYFFSHL